MLDALETQAGNYGVSIVRDRIKTLQVRDTAFIATHSQAVLSAEKVVLASGLIDRSGPVAGLEEAVEEKLVRYCPICDGFEASDLRIAVVGRADDAVKKALFLRTYSQNVTLLELNGSGGWKPHADELSKAGIRLPTSPLQALRRQGRQIIAGMSDGTSEVFDVIYPVLGCDVRSELGKTLGARHNETGCLEVDAHQQTSVAGLYAIGDVVSDLHQIAVATGHAAIAATHIHNALPRNLR